MVNVLLQELCLPSSHNKLSLSEYVHAEVGQSLAGFESLRVDRDQVTFLRRTKEAVGGSRK